MRRPTPRSARTTSSRRALRAGARHRRRGARRRRSPVPVPPPGPAATAATAAAPPATLRGAPVAVAVGRRRPAGRVARAGVADLGLGCGSGVADSGSGGVGQAGLFERDVGDVVGREAAVGRGVGVVVTEVDLVVVVVDDRRRQSPSDEVPGAPFAAPVPVPVPGLRRLRPPRDPRRRRRFGGPCRIRVRRSRRWHRRPVGPHRSQIRCVRGRERSVGRFVPRERGGAGGGVGRAGGAGRLRGRLVGHRFLLS